MYYIFDLASFYAFFIVSIRGFKVVVQEYVYSFSMI